MISECLLVVYDVTNTTPVDVFLIFSHVKTCRYSIVLILAVFCIVI